MDPAVIGWIATSLTTVSMIPQAIVTMRTKNTAGISLWMYILFVAGVVGFIVYGFLLTQIDFYAGLPILVGNVVTLVFSSITLSFKIYNVAKGKEPFGLGTRAKKKPAETVDKEKDK
jgi:MtN3 and saliva related transmembrane protein